MHLGRLPRCAGWQPALPRSTQADRSPLHFPIRGNLQNRDAWRRSTVGPRHASWIQEPHSGYPFIPRHVRVPVQNHVDIIRRVIRWNVNQPKPNSVPLQVDHERPVKIAVAISAHDRHWWAERLDRLQSSRGADIPKMPDFIRAGRESLKIRRHFVMCVGQDEDTKRRGHLEFSHDGRQGSQRFPGSLDARRVPLCPLCEA
jgi:hypothetical protein